MSRIGIYAGSFDPVHQGHIEFALAAIKVAKLDEVYFLPERQHRTKRGVTHLAHRLAMLALAVESKPNLKVLELPDRQFSVAKTLPRLNQRFPDGKLFLIIGSDVLEHLDGWPLIDSLLSRMRLIVGLRSGMSRQTANKWIRQLPTEVDSVVVVKSPDDMMSSASIRQTLLNGQVPRGLEPAVLDYIKANWLYASPSNSSSAS